MFELKQVIEAQGSSRQSLEWVELRSVGRVCLSVCVCVPVCLRVRVW